MKENTNTIQEVDDSTYFSKLKIFLALAIPSILWMLLLRFQYIFIISFIGNLGDKALIAGIGMANMTLNIIVVSIAYGLNGALETLVTQAYGARELDLCGVYLNRSRLVFTIFFIPCAVILLFTEKILVMCGQDEEASAAAQLYVNYFIPGWYLNCLNDGLRRFLNSLGLSKVPFYLYLLGSATCFGFCYLFIIYLNMGLKGAGLAVLISSTFVFVSMNIYASCIPSIRDAIQWPDMRIFNEINEYLQYGLPMAGLLCAENWAFELIIFMAGGLGVDQQASVVILFSLTGIFFQIPMGLQTPISAVIGHQIGKQDVTKAKEYNSVAYHVSFSCLAMTILFYVMFNTQIFSLMTNVPEIQKVCIDATALMAFFVFTDGTQGFLQGQIKALGQQQRTLKIAIPIYWLVHVPLGWFWAFKLNQEMQGFWQAGLVSTGIMSLTFWCIIERTDWHKVATESKERTSKGATGWPQSLAKGKPIYAQLELEEDDIHEGSIEDSFNSVDLNDSINN